MYQPASLENSSNTKFNYRNKKERFLLPPTVKEPELRNLVVVWTNRITPLQIGFRLGHNT